MNPDPELPVLDDGPRRPAELPGEPQPVRDAYDALTDHSSRKRGTR